jgi:hypothetical protein
LISGSLDPSRITDPGHVSEDRLSDFSASGEQQPCRIQMPSFGRPEGTMGADPVSHRKRTPSGWIDGLNHPLDDQV